MIRSVLSNNKGFGSAFLISVLAMLLFFVVFPIFFLLPFVMEEMQSFRGEVTTDCFLASRSAIIQMKSYQKLNDMDGVFDTNLCKGYFLNHLALTFSLNNSGTDFLAAAGGGYVRSVEITEYSLDTSDPEQPKLISQVNVTTKIPFSSRLPQPVHKIRNVINIKYLED